MSNELKEARERLGLSLSQAAKAIGCSGTHLLEIERGSSSNPRASIVIGISETYGMPADIVLYLFESEASND